jgi:ABC-type branched-subunit amino acid transport system substrate-binding protein
MPKFIPSPYIVGTPIINPKDFFGRNNLFNDINDFLKNNEQIILLHGQRRIGKSSVLRQIPKKLSTDEFVFIDSDFQKMETSSTSKILRSIAIDIKNEIEKRNDELSNHLAENTILILTHLAENTNSDSFREFLSAVYQQIGNKKLVLLWDEFDVLIEKDSDNFCNYIRQLLEKDQKLFIIPIVGRNISKLPNLVSSLRLKFSKEIGLLDKNHTKELIIKPAEKSLIYEEEAIEAIFNLSAGHPYFTQVVCLTLFELARSREQYNISCQDVCNSNIVEKIFKDDQACAGLAWFWDGLTPEQQVIFAAAAEAQNKAIQKNEALQNPLMLLRNYGIVETEYLKKAEEQLSEYGFLDNAKVKIELVYRWLIKAHKLKDEIIYLETVKQENVNNLLLVADDLQKQGDTQALKIYELALNFNPNNFRIVMSLAGEYLKIGQLNQAHELYERAYHFYDIIDKQESVLQPLLYLAKKYSDEENVEQALKIYKLALEIYKLAYDINKESSKHGFLQTIENYVHELIVAGEWIKATEECELGLQIDPDRISFQQRLKEIQVLKSKTNLNVEDTNYVPLQIQTIENYVHELIVAEEWTKAREQCELGLQIDPHSILFQQRLKEIQVLKSKTNLNVEDTNNIPVKNPSGMMSKWLNLNSILTAALGLAGIVVIGAGVSQFFKTCPTGERKELGVFCMADNTILNSRISRGDRTFFSEITDIPRDKGIQAFKQGNYQLAANLFQQAVKANQNDPEVLIYYNNALARKQGSPFTLAVVVPLDKNQDDRNNGREILRGVAQAQDQFNQKNGLNSRLLEIVIANDSNTGKAKEVAQELTEDSSILGVIGHNSSDATRAVIPEYEKAKLAVISSTSTSIFLNNPVFFRAVNSDESAGKTLAEYTYKNLKLKKAVIFANPNSPYSNSIREVFTNQFEKLGGEVVRKPLIDLTASIFDPEKEVTKSVYANNAKAEAALLFPDTRSTNIALNTAKEITKRNERLKTQKRPELKMLGGDTLYTHEILTNGGNNVEGLIIAAPWFRETSQAKSFANKADKKWGGPISWRTATSFDATQALIKTLSNNPSRSTVLRGLENVSLPASETSGYPLKFTSEREREGESILLQVKGNQFVQIDPPAKP